MRPYTHFQVPFLVPRYPRRANLSTQISHKSNTRSAIDVQRWRNSDTQIPPEAISDTHLMLLFEHLYPSQQLLQLLTARRGCSKFGPEALYQLLPISQSDKKGSMRQYWRRVNKYKLSAFAIFVPRLHKKRPNEAMHTLCEEEGCLPNEKQWSKLKLLIKSILCRTMIQQHFWHPR